MAGKLGHANSTTTQLVYSHLMWRLPTSWTTFCKTAYMKQRSLQINKNLLDTTSQKRPPDFSGGLDFTGAIGQSRTDAPLLRRSLLGPLIQAYLMWESLVYKGFATSPTKNTQRFLALFCRSWTPFIISTRITTGILLCIFPKSKPPRAA